MNNIRLTSFFIALFLFNSVFAQDKNELSQKLNLNECIKLSLENNNQYKASVLSIEAAFQRTRQAASAHYPKLSLNSAVTMNDEPPTYIAPPMSVQTPAINLGVFSVPSLQFEVPSQLIKMADKVNFQAQVDMVYPIFTGGKITSIINQAEAGLEIARQESQASKARIIYETKKLYYACILSANLESIAQETLERLSSTLNITESLYKSGSTKVTKIEYLKNKTMVDLISSVLSGIKGEKKIAEAALANAIGFEWNKKVTTADEIIQLNQNTESLESLVALLLERNPVIKKVDQGLNVFQEKIDEAKSDLYPSLALIGMYRGTYNNYEYGTITQENKHIWMMGLGLSMNLFDGFRNYSKIDEAKTNVTVMSEQKEALRKGLTLKLQALYLKMQSNQERETHNKDALKSAEENRALIEKAYLNDIKELEDVLTAQLTEAMLKAQYQIQRFEYADVEAQLSELIFIDDNTIN